jgi:hypothetical protein
VRWMHRIYKHCELVQKHTMLTVVANGCKRHGIQPRSWEPVTIRMIRFLKSKLGDNPTDSDKILYGGLMLCFFFLGRGGEFWGSKHALKMKNIKLWSGKNTRWTSSGKKAQSVSVKWETDKTNSDAEVNLFASGDKWMCPVEAALWIHKGRVGLKAKGKKLTDKASCGSSRAKALSWLKEAARATGVPEKLMDRIVLHSLRVGGTTVLAAAGYDEMIVRLHGRWKSATVRLYAHRTPTTFIGVSERMMAIEAMENRAWGSGDGGSVADSQSSNSSYQA